MSRGVCVGSVVEREEEVRMREVSALNRQSKALDSRIEIAALVCF